MAPCASSRSADHAPPCVPAAAALLVSSRALLDAADLIERSIAHVTVADYAGWDVMRGLGGLSVDEADAATHDIVRATLLALCEQVRDQADHDWQRAVASIGSTVRATRRSPKRVQHRPSRRPPTPVRAVPMPSSSPPVRAA